jgi:hypothetical protein
MGIQSNGSIFAYKYLTSLEVNDTGKHSSFLQYGHNYARENFVSIFTWSLYHKTYYGHN